LADVADPERAEPMRAYMKSALPFYGIPKPMRVKALRPVWSAHPASGRVGWEATIRVLYDEALYREERYAALDLLGLRVARPWHDVDLVPLLEHLVTTGAWWDLVDEVASHHLAPLHRADPVALMPVIRSWASSPDLWLRRAAVLSQLGSRAATDTELLREVIEAAAPSREFFVRKAIGWALRDLSYADPQWVAGYLAEAGDRLSPLSRREASRHLG
jgi:3-methyladenine DNA glycosylase AlkD